MSLNPQDFWQFSLAHYAQAGVQPACMTLQNTYQGNVNLALLLHWLDTQHIALTLPELDTLIAGLYASDVRLQQFRTMRKQLKTQLDQTGYQQLLAFELTLEQDQQHNLVAQCNQFEDLTPKHAARSDNLASYCKQLKASVLLHQLQARP
ncbi:TIGR02444 family protein [Photobacterium sp. SDRW27]|uniref:TIGR02444 family protein n=1 Tax=Photobacterium obscurum TaxID=2829490 RepID=UPI002243127C|nr:TIGR02444 family protein [Photobacterium obscurum]MCW8329665.1 TIGR02444 family protein [Photobacterium obscurum]